MSLLLGGNGSADVGAATYRRHMDRITYTDVGTLLDRLLLAHEAEIRGGATPELRAATDALRAELDVILYKLSDKPQPPWVPEDDPLLPKKRRHV